MKKLILLISMLFLLVLVGCSKDNKDIRVHKHKAVYSWVVINKNSYTITGLNINTLSSFNKEILKLAIKGDIKKCEFFQWNKKECYQIATLQRKYLKNLNCDKLLFYKEYCFDKYYRGKLECSKIHNEVIKKDCILHKDMLQVIKSKDINWCKKFPYPFRKECELEIKKLLTK